MKNSTNKQIIQQELIRFFLELDLSDLAINEIEKTFLQYLKVEYVNGIEWLLYWNSDNSYKMSYPKNIYKTFKNKGEVFKVLLTLVIECLPHLPPLSPQDFLNKTLEYFPYAHPHDGLKKALKESTILPDDPSPWFLWLLIEEIFREFWIFRSPGQPKYKYRHKQSIFANRRAYIQQLSQLYETKEIINPILTNTIIFYQTCEQLASQRNSQAREFKANFWRPYIKALRQENQYKEKSQKFGTTRVVNGKLAVDIGKGRGTKIKRPIMTNPKN